MYLRVLSVCRSALHCNWLGCISAATPPKTVLGSVAFDFSLATGRPLILAPVSKLYCKKIGLPARGSGSSMSTSTVWTKATAFAFMTAAVLAMHYNSWGAAVVVVRLWWKRTPVLSLLLLSVTAAIAWFEQPRHSVLDVIAVLLLTDVLDTRTVERSPPPSLF